MYRAALRLSPAPAFPGRPKRVTFVVMDTAPTYLVVVDGSAESRVALRFAAMIPTATYGTVEVRPLVVWN